MLSRIAVGFGLLTALLRPVFAQDVGAVLVVDRVGQVTLAGPGAARPVATLAALPLGAHIRLEPGARIALLVVATGEEYAVTGAGEAQVDAAGVSASGGASVQRRAPNAAKPLQLRGESLAMGGVVMRSAGLRARFPAGVVMNAPDRLAWDSLAANGRFHVQMRDAAGQVLLDLTAQGSSVPFPQGVELQPDERYTWTVSLDGGVSSAPVSSASFSLAPAALREEARRLTPDASAAFSDRLLYGLWLEQVGALGEARQLWRQLAESRPDDDALAARARR